MCRDSESLANSEHFYEKIRYHYEHFISNQFVKIFGL
mgnify:FL=1